MVEISCQLFMPVIPIFWDRIMPLINIIRKFFLPSLFPQPSFLIHRCTEPDYLIIAQHAKRFKYCCFILRILFFPFSLLIILQVLLLLKKSLL